MYNGTLTDDITAYVAACIFKEGTSLLQFLQIIYTLPAKSLESPPNFHQY
ncbi:hypothetical protein WH47_10915 [Habropoda laboriosa]|uniref:Uncharacterized protein n=1 Tax=Habropoda laboriosa TaxID=597456 RepID=A0A0L7QKE7_9HYME|nr:hypothetical protein WH47_10915 [Habropoda laboriosa]